MKSIYLLAAALLVSACTTNPKATPRDPSSLKGEQALMLPRPMEHWASYHTTQERKNVNNSVTIADRVYVGGIFDPARETAEISFTPRSFGIQFTGANGKINHRAIVHFLHLLSTSQISALRSPHITLNYEDLCMKLEGTSINIGNLVQGGDGQRKQYSRLVAGKSLNGKIEIAGPDECSLEY